jgi:hypothetical protein
VVRTDRPIHWESTLPASPTGLDDVGSRVVDASTGSISTLCPADEVSVAAGNAPTCGRSRPPAPRACPAGSLNGDADTSDSRRAALDRGRPAQNLGLAATGVKLSPTIVVALASRRARATPT